MSAISIQTNLARLLYNIIHIVCLPLIFCRLLWRSRLNPAYRERWLERLGIFTAPKNQKNGIWLHAVSVGESLAAIPLIKAIQKQFPNTPITMTSTTPTGSARIQQMLNNQVFHVYFPYDLPFAMDGFIKRLDPKLCLIMETEIWPNCLWRLQHHQIPVVIVNGRLSPRSIKGYQKLKPVIQELMKCVTEVAAQSTIDEERFLSLGLARDRLQVTGNIKFDINVPEDIENRAQALRQGFGEKRLVWIAASTHNGEEELILNTFRNLRKDHPDLLLVLAPRHPERREAVMQLIKDQKFTFAQRSIHAECKEDTAVLLVDTLGEMPLFYAAADVAFVGGSFAAIGGHNTLEPAFASIPVAVGPHVHNFIDITDYLSKAGALIQVQDEKGLFETINYWLNDETARIEAGQTGKQVVENNRGAVNKVINIIQKYIH